MSRDARWVAFVSEASNLAPNQPAQTSGIYVRDRLNGTTERISVSSDGTPANDHCVQPSMSRDGRFVAFVSWADNLVPGDTNKRADVFVHDRDTGRTGRISVSSDGIEGDEDCFWPVISADGDTVAFFSRATNLVSNDTNGVGDIFIRERSNGLTARVSVEEDGSGRTVESSWPSMNADGRYISYTSGAIFRYDRQSGSTRRVDSTAEGVEGNGRNYRSFVSPDGGLVLFTSHANNLVKGDTNNTWDVFLKDMRGGPVERISVTTDGVEGERWSFISGGYDRCSAQPLSAGGRHVTFMSASRNMASPPAGRWQVYVRIREEP